MIFVASPTDWDRWDAVIGVVRTTLYTLDAVLGSTC